MNRRAAVAALALVLAVPASGQQVIYDQAGHPLARVAPAIGSSSGVSVEPGGLPWRVDFSGNSCGFVWHSGSVPDPFFMPLNSEAEAASLFAVIGAGTHPAAASTGCCQLGQETAPADAGSRCGYTRVVNIGKICGNSSTWEKIACEVDPPPSDDSNIPIPVDNNLSVCQWKVQGEYEDCDPLTPANPPSCPTITGSGECKKSGPYKKGGNFCTTIQTHYWSCGGNAVCTSSYIEVWFRIGTMGGAPALDTVQLECPAGMQARDDRPGWGPNLHLPGSNTNWYSSLGAAQAAPATACVSRPAGCGA